MATNSTKRRGLGRGLGALIVNTDSANPATGEEIAAAGAEAGGVVLLAVEDIAPNPQQPRTHFDESALADLATSIREHGIIQPLIVTENPRQAGGYWLIAGERRWRAARLAELSTVPVIVRDASPQQLVEWALVENIQRADLNPLEEAAAYRTLVEEFALTQSEIGQRVGKSRSAVANTLRLLQLPATAQEALTNEAISAGHARALLALPNHDMIEQVLQRVLRYDLTVRQTEELVKQVLAAPRETDSPSAATEETSPLDEQIAFLESRFRAALGTRVNLNRNADGSGRLVVHFYNDEDLDNLYQQIAGGDELL